MDDGNKTSEVCLQREADVVLGKAGCNMKSSLVLIPTGTFSYPELHICARRRDLVRARSTEVVLVSPVHTISVSVSNIY